MSAGKCTRCFGDAEVTHCVDCVEACVDGEMESLLSVLRGKLKVTPPKDRRAIEVLNEIGEAVYARMRVRKETRGARRRTAAAAITGKVVAP